MRAITVPRIILIWVFIVLAINAYNYNNPGMDWGDSWGNVPVDQRNAIAYMVAAYNLEHGTALPASHISDIHGSLLKGEYTFKSIGILAVSVALTVLFVVGLWEAMK